MRDENKYLICGRCFRQAEVNDDAAKARGWKTRDETHRDDECPSCFDAWGKRPEPEDPPPWRSPENKPIYGRVLERVDINDNSSAANDKRPWSVTVTFNFGAGARFRYKTKSAAYRAWRKLVGLAP